MKAVIGVVMLAVGLVLGLAGGMVIRVPEAVSDPRMLLPEDPPDSCMRVVEAAEEMAEITSGYLSLVRDTYIPMIEQRGGEDLAAATPSAGASEPPAVGGMLGADGQLADLSDRTARASATFNEAKVLCRSQVRE